VPIVFILDGGAAVLKGLPESVVIVVVAVSVLVMAVVAVMLVDATLKIPNLFVLAFVELGLFALFDDAVVEVDSRGEGAGDGGDECG